MFYFYKSFEIYDFEDFFLNPVVPSYTFQVNPLIRLMLYVVCVMPGNYISLNAKICTKSCNKNKGKPL